MSAVQTSVICSLSDLFMSSDTEDVDGVDVLSVSFGPAGVDTVILELADDTELVLKDEAVDLQYGSVLATTVDGDRVSVGFRKTNPLSIQDVSIVGDPSELYLKDPKKLLLDLLLCLDAVFDQMRKSKWKDQEGHDVQMNASLKALKLPMLQAAALLASED